MEPIKMIKIGDRPGALRDAAAAHGVDTDPIFFHEIAPNGHIRQRLKLYQFRRYDPQWLIVARNGDLIWNDDGDVFSDTLDEYGVDLDDYCVTWISPDDQEHAMAQGRGGPQRQGSLLHGRVGRALRR
jgi:hypothetical protein